MAWAPRTQQKRHRTHKSPVVRLVWACKSGVGGGWAGMLVHRLCLLWYFRLEGLKKALSLDNQGRGADWTSSWLQTEPFCLPRDKHKRTSVGLPRTWRLLFWVHAPALQSPASAGWVFLCTPMKEMPEEVLISCQLPGSMQLWKWN